LGRIARTRDAELAFLKGQVLAAVGSMTILIEKHFSPANALEVFIKPSRRVVVTKDVPAHSLILGLDSHFIREVAEGSDIDQPEAFEVTLQPPCPKFRFFIAPPKGEKVCSPAFLVATTEDHKKANMMWIKLSVSSLIAFDFVGSPRPSAAEKAKAKAKAKAAAAPALAAPSPEDDQQQVAVHVPVLINTKALKAGSELLLHAKAPVKRAAKAAAPITTLDVVKRTMASK
jgi:hypothetical protein